MNLRKHFMYGAWAGMVNRCHNPNNSAYGRYGAVGTKVCDRWRYGEDGKSGFQCFLADMGERPEGKTLDRHPNSSGNYEPGNCRWATLAEQRQNISARGDAKMRKAMSRGVARRWKNWRLTNTARLELTRAQQRRLLELAECMIAPPTDGRERKTLEALVGFGFAGRWRGSYQVTSAGLEWLAGWKNSPAASLRSALRFAEPEKRNGK